MKFYSTLGRALLFPAIALSFAACKQSGQAASKKTPVPYTATLGAGKNLITFKVNGTKVVSSGWTISRFSYSGNPGHQWLNITSNMHDEKRTVNLNLSGISSGDYALGKGGAFKSSHGSYYPDYPGNLTNNYSFKTGVFHIETLDTVRRTLNATFSGMVQNLRGESLEITEGRIENGLVNIGVMRY